MDANIIRYILIFQIIYELLLFLIAYMKSYLPRALIRFILFGKINIKTHHPIIAKIEIPRKYLDQDIFIIVPLSGILFYFAVNKYVYNENISENLFSLLDTLLGASRKPLVSAESTILAIVLFSIHGLKRAYVVYYACVHSNKKINIFHYAFTFVHYLMFAACLIGESKGFVRGSHATFSFHKLTTMQLMWSFIFLWSTYMQLRSNYILAGLRKNKHGDVVTKEHKIPFGELFNYVSSPLQLTEILMYLMLSAILWQSTTIHYFTIFVIMNQVECAILANHWYRNTFKNYPKERKLLIPYIW